MNNKPPKLGEPLEARFEVTKRTNPTKRVDCIVLEFDDPIAQQVIRIWAMEMRKLGYEQVYQDTVDHLNRYEEMEFLKEQISDAISSRPEPATEKSNK